MKECPICKKSYANNPHCGLRLFNSQNECAICLENKTEMVALPCGHQFCKADLARIGISVVKPPEQPVARSAGSPSLPVFLRPPPRRRYRRRRSTIFLTTFLRNRAGRARKRCGWCGHFGHQVRKCRQHQAQCGCSSFKTRSHKLRYKNKHQCPVCKKRGHSRRTCSNIVKVN